MNFKKYHVSRNLFDISKVMPNVYVSNQGDSLKITTPSTTAGVVAGSPYTLQTYCPNLQVGDVVILSFVSTGSAKYIYLQGENITWASGQSKTITSTMLSSAIIWYASGASTEAIISNIMLNLGSEALPYEPYSSEVWHDTPHYIHNTSTDTFTTLPAVVCANGTTATVGLKGQTLQSSTPSPTSPVMPQGTGERSAQLIPYPFYSSDGEYAGVQFTTDNGRIIANGTLTSGLLYYLWRPAKFQAGTYTMSVKGKHSGATIYFRDTAHNVSVAYIYGAQEGDRSVTFTVAEEISAMVYVNAGSGTVDFDCTIMLNVGEEALPFEPTNGYKIPISSANTTTPVYLGEVETTRRVKKLVLDGTGGWNRDNATGVFSLDIPNSLSTSSQSGISSHWQFEQNRGVYTLLAEGHGCIRNAYDKLWIRDNNFPTVADFKSYLAAQYAAGTPVTVWYVLATETTGIVNEPLRKIGNYADEVSNISIPVTAGANTLSVDTTLQPSEVTVNYKGWHPVADVHEYEGGGTNLFDAEAAYGKMYNDGVVSGTPQNIYAVKNYFTSDEIGKQLTISVYAESVTSNRAEMFVFINGVRTTSNSINRGQQGTMTFTVIPTSTSDNWTITYGSGGDINSFSNLTVTEEPHWD